MNDKALRDGANMVLCSTYTWLAFYLIYLIYLSQAIDLNTSDRYTLIIVDKHFPDGFSDDSYTVRDYPASRGLNPGAV